MSEVFRHIRDVDATYLLCFVGGFIDAAGYLKFRGVFTSSITGNLVVACASVASIKGVFCRSMVTISFTLSGALSAAFAFYVKNMKIMCPRTLSIFLFSFEAVLLLAVWIVGLKLNTAIIQATSIDDAPIVIAASLMGSSMGFQSYAVKDTVANSPPTTVMTSTLINLASHFSNALGFTALAKLPINISVAKINAAPSTDAPSFDEQQKLVEAKQQEFWTKFVSTGKPLLAFLIGCIIGSVAMYRIEFWGISIPFFILVFLIMEIIWKHQQKRNVSDVERA